MLGKYLRTSFVLRLGKGPVGLKEFGLKQEARHIVFFLLHPKAFSSDLPLSALGPEVGDLI